MALALKILSHWRLEIKGSAMFFLSCIQTPKRPFSLKSTIISIHGLYESILSPRIKPILFFTGLPFWGGCISSQLAILNAARTGLYYPSHRCRGRYQHQVTGAFSRDNDAFRFEQAAPLRRSPRRQRAGLNAWICTSAPVERVIKACSRSTQIAS